MLVPLHRTRQKERGFKQVDLFGRPPAGRLGLPYQAVLLKRERRGRKNTCYISVNDGKPYVAFLQSEKAAGLTICGYCF